MGFPFAVGKLPGRPSINNPGEPGRCPSSPLNPYL
jgi:hypothetical protein